MDYKIKYLKYKIKYFNLKNMIGGTLINFKCPGTICNNGICTDCPKEHINIDIHTCNIICEECKNVLYLQPINLINNLSKDNLNTSENIKSTMNTLIRELVVAINNIEIPIGKGASSINKCKFINNEEINADIIMNYDTTQKTDIYNHNSINEYINKLDKEQDSEPYYFCFLISENGLKMARVYDVLEYGASHMMMSDRDERIIIAGELKIQDNKIYYNFESGSINYNSLISKYVQKGLIKIEDKKGNVGTYITLAPFFYIYKMLANKLLSLSFSDYELIFTSGDLIKDLKNKNIRKETIDKICRNPFDRVSTYVINHQPGEKGNSYNRCTNDSFFRMTDGDGKMNYTKLDADISTMRLFKDNPGKLNMVADIINNKKILTIPDVPERPGGIPQTLQQAKYEDYLLCKK